ncbi:MAG: hypothetical protein RQ824_12990, partial [bacterium]|nr:hypothetical protein [bacterium]
SSPVTRSSLTRTDLSAPGHETAMVGGEPMQTRYLFCGKGALCPPFFGRFDGLAKVIGAPVSGCAERPWTGFLRVHRVE